MMKRILFLVIALAWTWPVLGQGRAIDKLPELGSLESVDYIIAVDSSGTDPRTRKILLSVLYPWLEGVMTLDNLQGTLAGSKVDSGIDAANITTGTIPAARIGVTGVTQHEGSIDHDALTNFVANEHLDWTTDQGATNIPKANVPSASEADALAANGANCSAGNYPLGVDASGAAESCTSDDDSPDSDAEVPDDITVDNSTGVTTSGKVEGTEVVADQGTLTDATSLTWDVTTTGQEAHLALDDDDATTAITTSGTHNGQWLTLHVVQDATDGGESVTLDGETLQLNETASAETRIYGHISQGGLTVFDATTKVFTAATAPSTCEVGDVFFDTDATAGQNLYGCTAEDTWTLQGDGSGGGGMIMSFGPNSNLGPDTDTYMSISEWGALAAAPVPVPVGGSVTALYCRVNNAPGAGENVTWTVTLEASDTAISCSASDSGTECSDTGSEAVAAGEEVTIHAVSSVSATGGRNRCSILIE